LYLPITLLWPDVKGREYRFSPPRRWRFDFAYPARMLAVEVDGGTWVQGRHNRGAGMKADAEKMNAAALAGWRVLRFTREHIKSGEALDLIELALRETECSHGP